MSNKATHALIPLPLVNEVLGYMRTTPTGTVSYAESERIIGTFKQVAEKNLVSNEPGVSPSEDLEETPVQTPKETEKE